MKWNITYKKNEKWETIGMEKEDKGYFFIKDGERRNPFFVEYDIALLIVHNWTILHAIEREYGVHEYYFGNIKIEKIEE